MIFSSFFRTCGYIPSSLFSLSRVKYNSSEDVSKGSAKSWLGINTIQSFIKQTFIFG